MPDSGCISRFRRSTSRPDALPAARPSRSPGAADRRQAATGPLGTGATPCPAPSTRGRPSERRPIIRGRGRGPWRSSQHTSRQSTPLPNPRSAPRVPLQQPHTRPHRSPRRRHGLGRPERSCPPGTPHRDGEPEMAPAGAARPQSCTASAPPLGSRQHPPRTLRMSNPRPWLPAAHQRPAARGGGGGPSGPLPGGHARTPDRTLGRRVSRDHLQETWRPPLMS
jgi:hypothetical protein